VSAPPDHPGGSPIASTVPIPIESHSAEPAVATHPPSTDAALDARQKRLLSKAGYRARRSADAAFREAERQRVGKWRRTCPDKAKAQKKKARAKNYHRPFVPVDAEGQGYPGADIIYDGVRYPRHDTYLWGAAADDDRPPSWLMASETSGLNKRPLTALEILDWLLSLPERFGPAVFVMFSFGYDITQILKHLPYEKAWEIEKRETYSDKRGERRRIRHSPVLWKGYAITYVKGKSLDVWRLADPEKPDVMGRARNLPTRMALNPRTTPRSHPMDNVRETSTLIAADKVQGTDVFNTGGDRVGSVHDLMIDKQSGQVAYAIMSFGGFLGVGNSYHPLPWSLLRYNTNLGGYVVDIKESQLEDAPSYPAGTEPAWGDPDYERKLHDYYGIDPWGPPRPL
jgi:hypothetical protein